MSSEGRDLEQLAVDAASEDENVRRRAMTALGDADEGRAMHMLLAGLRDPATWVRVEAAQGLARWEDRRVREALTDAMLNDPEGYVRQSASFALMDIADESTVEPLLAAMNDDWPYVVENAALVLGIVGDMRAFDPLVAALRKGNEWIVANAARSLGNLGDPRALEHLRPLRDDPDEMIRASAREAIRKLEPGG